MNRHKATDYVAPNIMAKKGMFPKNYVMHSTT